MRFLLNRNVVTILGIVACLAIMIVCYNNRINNSLQPYSVPYAKVQIQPGRLITKDMVGMTQVPRVILDGTIHVYPDAVIDHYSNADTLIPEGSLFYARMVTTKEKLPANIVLDYPSGYVLYNLPVSTKTTYGNSVYPGNYIDIYLKAEPEVISDNAVENKVMVGKLISNIKVIAVKDEDGNSLFTDTQKSKKAPAMVIFAVPEEYYMLLKRAEFLRTYRTTLSLVPTNESLKEEPGELSIDSNQIKKWINEVTVWTES